MTRQLLISAIIFATAMMTASRTMAQEVSDTIAPAEEILTEAVITEAVMADTAIITPALPNFNTELRKEFGRPSIYDYPYSRTLSMPDWKHLWINTGVMVGAGVATMTILEALPADATAWNKKENAKISMWKRWKQNVTAGPVWDHDNLIFNYVLHPYAGAAYYMGARSCGLNCWGSFLYSFCISTIFWEYGFEAFNEIPSVQDLVITPMVGSIIGEGFYLVKRHIVSNGYRLAGSKVLGYAVAFLVDPLNECIGYFRGDQRKQTRRTEALRGLSANSWIAPSPGCFSAGISLSYQF